MRWREETTEKEQRRVGLCVRLKGGSVRVERILCDGLEKNAEKAARHRE